MHGFPTGAPVQCNVLPVARCDVEFLQSVLDVVLEAFLWPAWGLTDLPSIESTGCV